MKGSSEASVREPSPRRSQRQSESHSPPSDFAEAQLFYNFGVHSLDAAFFGLAIGLASWITVVPLFLDRFTDSALLVGMIVSVQPLGWHLPQLATAGRVSRLGRFLPMVMRMTIIERVPFFALALLALYASRLEPTTVIVATYLLVALIGLGGGLTATPFQAMVGKIVPMRRHGLFYGLKTAAANLLLAAGAVAAGGILGASPEGRDFAICFALAGLATVASWLILSRTREVEAEPAATASGLAIPLTPARGATLAASFGASGVESADIGDLDPTAAASIPGSAKAMDILRADPDFRWFIAARTLAQVCTMAAAYYTVYALRRFGADGAALGWMTALFAMAQALGNPLLGWAGDRWGHRAAMSLGLVAGSLGALIALLAPDISWLYGAYFLTGLANVAAFTLPLAMNLRFGTPAQRPTYIGLSSTLTAPSIFLAPWIGGILAEHLGYGATFGLAALGGLGAALILMRRLPAQSSVIKPA